MNTEQPLYGPHHQYEYGVAKCGLQDASTCFTKIDVLLKRHCILLHNADVFHAVKERVTKACLAAKITKSSTNVTNMSILHVF